MIVLAFTQIILRNFFSVGLDWADAFLRFLVLWVTMLGAGVTTREDSHITVDVISHVLPKRGQAAVRVATDLFTVVVCGLLANAAVTFLTEERAGGAQAFQGVPTWIAEIILPFAFGVVALRFAVYAGRHLWQAIKGVPAADEKEQAS
jgi:TRAP-type C4-dicarboxylate transport system permease small subunit